MPRLSRELGSSWKPRGFAWVITGLMLALSLAALDGTIVATALPTIVGEFGALDHLSWVVTSYMLASTIVQPIYGKIGDLVGRKPVFTFSIVLFLVGSVLSGAAQDMLQLIAFRGVQGLGGGGIFIGVLAIIADLVPPRERGRYVGVTGGVFAVASVVGPLVGGVITETAGWRWIFYINLPLGILALLTVVFGLRLERPVRRAVRIDYLGTLLLSMVSTALVLISAWAGTLYAWTSVQILGLGAVAVAAVILLVVVEGRVAEPVIPLTLFRIRNFVWPTAVGITTSVTLFAFLTYLPLYFQTVARVDAATSGLLLIPMSIAMLVSSLLSGHVISKTGRYRVFPIAACILALVGILTFVFTQALAPIGPVVATIILGLGLGCAVQNVTLIVQNSVPARDLGAATSAQSYFRQIGASLGVSIIGAIFVGRLAAEIENDEANGAGLDATTLSALTPDAMAAFPSGTQRIIAEIFASALPPTYLYLVPLLLVGLVLACLIRQTPAPERTPVGAD